MRCQDCGRQFDKLNEFVDGRKVLRLCSMCRAEREWRQNSDFKIPPPLKKKKSLWIKIMDFFKKRD